MHPAIREVFDFKRGCGWRQPGGFYLRGGTAMTACGKLPAELGLCPCCGQGIVPSRSMRRIDFEAIFADVTCKADEGTDKIKDCSGCLINTTKGGFLMPVSMSSYPTPGDFIREAARDTLTGTVFGISKRVAKNSSTGFPTLPAGFKVGESVVALSHKRAIITFEPDPEHGKLVEVSKLGVFAIFKPSSIEYVVRGNESDEFINELMGRGFTPVKVTRIDDAGEQMEIPDEEVGDNDEE